MINKQTTTCGMAACRDGLVTIQFSVLDPQTMTVRDLELDVDGYALELARDLLAALSERSCLREEAT